MGNLPFTEGPMSEEHREQVTNHLVSQVKAIRKQSKINYLILIACLVLLLGIFAMFFRVSIELNFKDFQYRQYPSNLRDYGGT